MSARCSITSSIITRSKRAGRNGRSLSRLTATQPGLRVRYSVDTTRHPRSARRRLERPSPALKSSASDDDPGAGASAIAPRIRSLIVTADGVSLFHWRRALKTPRQYWNPVLNWNHQPIKPYTLGLARESGGMADAQGSGPCERKLVGVQVPSLAPIHFSLAPLGPTAAQLGEGMESPEVLLPLVSGPWHFATSSTLAPTADAISASERPDSVCNFTMLQSTRSADSEQQRSKCACHTQLAKRVNHRKFSSGVEFYPKSEHAHDIINRRAFTSHWS